MAVSGGKNIESLVPLLQSVDATVLTGPEQLINDSTAFRSYIWAQQWRFRKAMSSTTKIRDVTILSKGRQGQYVGANVQVNPTANASAVPWETGWAQFLNWAVLTEEEIEFNQGDRREKIKDIIKLHVIPMHTDTLDRLEADLWADPHPDMESPGVDGTRLPYSYKAIITPDGNVPTAFSSAGVNTIENVNPSQYPNWKNQSVTITDPTTELHDAMFELWWLCGWNKPTVGPLGSQDNTPIVRSRTWYCDFETARTLRNFMKESNQNLRVLDEHDGVLFYGGAPIIIVESLGGPGTDIVDRLMFLIDHNNCFPIIHKNRFMQLLRPSEGSQFWVPTFQPLSRILYELTRWNIIAQRRRTSGVIRHPNKTW